MCFFQIYSFSQQTSPLPKKNKSYLPASPFSDEEMFYSKIEHINDLATAMHKLIYQKALQQGISLNKFIEKALKKELKGPV